MQPRVTIRDVADIDAFAREGTALFNTCAGNARHGIFIEEGVVACIAFGNDLFGNRQAGLHVWNERVTGNTGNNVVAVNRATGNRNGVTAGGRSATRTADGNLFFNNICLDNWQ